MTPQLRVGGAACECTVCGKFFRSESGFVKHRTGHPDHRRCLTTEAMETIGMATNDEGYWLGEPASLRGRRNGIFSPGAGA